MKFNKVLKLTSILASITLAFGCSAPQETVDTGVDTIVEEDFDRHLSILASDDFLGRGPFSEGEEKTIHYLESEFKKMGLEPGNNGSYFQDVPMVEISSTVPEIITISNGTDEIQLNHREDFVAFSQRLEEEIVIESSDLVFVGYGIVAPEFEWNDYEGLDVEGKTVMVLVNDPGFASGDSAFFKGEAMTYYGRWTYKYEEAARQGAAGVFVIHSTIPAGYPWKVVRNSWSGTGLYLKSGDGNKSHCAMEGWITMDAAEKIFGMSTSDFADYKTRARNAGFSSIPTGFSYNITITNEWFEDLSKNVVAVLPGTSRSDEYIIYSAHWDHFGVSIPDNEGDSIYNGALDNATGTTAMLEVAEAFSSQKGSFERSIVFLAVTAEEQGLLGSAYYAENPIYPVEKTVANINIDGLYYFGPLRDVTIIGYGQSELDEYAKEAADEQGRYIVPDQEAGKGYFFRSDHFNFAKVGIPALFAAGDHDLVNGGVDLMSEKKLDYNTKHYHLPADEYLPEVWDLSGMVMDARLLYNVGAALANDGHWPQWKEGSEFKAIRESYMGN